MSGILASFLSIESHASRFGNQKDVTGFPRGAVYSRVCEFRGSPCRSLAFISWLLRLASPLFVAFAVLSITHYAVAAPMIVDIDEKGHPVVPAGYNPVEGTVAFCEGPANAAATACVKGIGISDFVQFFKAGGGLLARITVTSDDPAIEAPQIPLPTETDFADAIGSNLNAGTADLFRTEPQSGGLSEDTSFSDTVFYDPPTNTSPGYFAIGGVAVLYRFTSDAAVPEPSTLSLIVVALMALGVTILASPLRPELSASY